MTAPEIQARLREIDDWLREREAAEMTEGGLGYGRDSDEMAELYQEREELLQQLSQAA
ncbi:MAG TPA: hypothetical protein VFU76_11815 [Terriglobales bacterium]|nr:hypothetical protein [Terriglobales bacterium]